MLPLALLLWGLLALGIAHLLAATPPAVTATDGWWRRVKVRLMQGGYWLFLIVAFALTLFTVGLTMRAIGIAMD